MFHNHQLRVNKMIHVMKIRNILARIKSSTKVTAKLFIYDIFVGWQNIPHLVTNYIIMK